MTRKTRRLYLLGIIGIALSLSTALILIAFEDNIIFFYTPSNLVDRKVPPGQKFRLGGLVENNSVQRSPDGLTIFFKVVDGQQNIPVSFRGLLPDLFREGQGVIAEGALNSKGTFVATEVLAKHDENYLPKEVAEALKKNGQWQGKK